MEAVTTGREKCRIVIELPPEPPTEEVLRYQQVLAEVQEIVDRNKNPLLLGRRFAEAVLTYGQAYLTDEFLDTLEWNGLRLFEEGFNTTVSQLQRLGYNVTVQKWKSYSLHATLYVVKAE